MWGHCRIFVPQHEVICAAAARPAQQKVGVVCLPTIFFFIIKILDSYQQLLKFPRAGNRDEGQLQKTEVV